MKGLEILDSFTQIDYRDVTSLVMCLFIVCATVAIVTLLLCEPICWLFILLAIVFGINGDNMCKTDRLTDSHQYYKVLIDDSVTMSEFTVKYEIISTEGKIVTIKEIEPMKILK